MNRRTGPAPLLAAALHAACAGAAGTAAPTAGAGAYAGADTVRFTAVATGVRHGYVWRAEGPWAIHVLEVDAERCRPVVRARKAGPPLGERATVSALARDALAAVNADFFALPGGAPIGAHVDAGEVVVSPGARPVLTIATGRYRAGPVLLDAQAWAGADTIRISAVNRPADGGLVLQTRWWRGEGNETAAALALAAVAGSGRTQRGVAALPGAESQAIRLLAVDSSARAWLSRRRSGDTVSWHAAVLAAADREPVDVAVGGYPRLLAGRRPVMHEETDLRPEFAASRHPRTAVGWSEAGRRVWWVVVDGRQSPYSDGMTLEELASLFSSLGAEDAINLDGGGSSTMVLMGRVANRPSDRQGERPVGNALVIERCENREA